MSRIQGPKVRTVLQLAWCDSQPSTIGRVLVRLGFHDTASLRLFRRVSCRVAASPRRTLLRLALHNPHINSCGSKHSIYDKEKKKKAQKNEICKTEHDCYLHFLRQAITTSPLTASTFLSICRHQTCPHGSTIHKHDGIARRRWRYGSGMVILLRH